VKAIIKDNDTSKTILTVGEKLIIEGILDRNSATIEILKIHKP
jgi:hypothetical protein